MLQLLKQVLKSFKNSFLLIFSLIFITSIIVFTSFSSLYLGSNISDSLEHLNRTGRKSDAIMNLDYQNNDIKFLPKQPDSNNPEIGKPVNQEIVVTKQLDVDSTNSNQKINDWLMVFPYTAEMFENPAINSDPYNARTMNMIVSAGADANGKAYPMNLTNPNKWASFSYGFKAKDDKFPPTIFDNIVYTTDSKHDGGPIRLLSYFDELTFKSEINIVKGHFRPKDKSVLTAANINKLDKVVPYADIDPNLSFLDQPYVDNLPVSPNADLDLINLTDKGQIYNFLLDPQNTKTETHPVYSFIIDSNSLSAIQKETLDYLQNQYLQSNNIDSKTKRIKGVLENVLEISFPIKDSWVTPSGSNNPLTIKQQQQKQDNIKTVINSILTKLSDYLKDFLSEFFDEVIYNQLKKENLLGDDARNSLDFSYQSQFVITDKQTSNNYIISKKDDVNIDKIVYTEGSKLEYSVDEYDKYSLFEKEKHLSFDDASKNKYYFKNLIYFFKDAITTGDFPNPAYLTKSLDDLTTAFKNSSPIDEGQYKYVMAYFYMGSSIKDPFSFIQFNEQGLGFPLPLKNGLTQIYNDTWVVKPNINAYTAVVNEKFLQLNNKHVYPIDLWKIAKKKNPVDFVKWLDNLDEKYTIKINSKKFVIIGSGLSPEMAFPSVSYTTPFPTPSNDAVVYVTNGGYQSLLSTSPFANEYKYFSLDFNNKVSYNGIFSAFNSQLNPYNKKLINALNEKFKSLINNNSPFPIVYSLNDFANVQNILTIRTNVPLQLQLIIVSISLTTIIVLVILVLYLSYLLIKGYINKNQVELAIIKSNGFSSLAITIAISIVGLIAAVLSGIIGYTVAYFLQNIFYSIVSNYWYAPMAFNPFSPLGFFGGILLVGAVFVLYTFIIVKLTFKKPINELMSLSIDVKHNVVLNVIKKPTNKIKAVNKLRISLFFSNVWRSIFLVGLSSICLTTISMGFSLSSKINESYTNVIDTKNYSYRFSLHEPTEQTGLYKLQKFSNLGFTDLSQGLLPIYKADEVDNEIVINGIANSSKKGMYYNNNFYTINNRFGYPYDLKDLKVRNLDGTPKLDEDGNYIYMGNLFFPSFRANNLLNSYPGFFANTTFTKWILDFTVPTFNLNPWDIVKSVMPSEIISIVESQEQEFLKEIWNDPDLGVDAKKYLLYDTAKNIYSLNPNKIMGAISEPENIGFSKEFLKFIGKVYGKESLSDKDIKLSFTVIPYQEGDETFSSANVLLFKEKKQNWELLDDNINLIGIKQNSKHITLMDDYNNNLNELLYKNPSSQDLNNIVVNSGASYQYGLNVGDIIEVESNNGYFKYSIKTLNELGLITDDVADDKLKNQKFKLQIVGISNMSFGNEFYVTQEVANLINGSHIDKNNVSPTSDLASFVTNGSYTISNATTGEKQIEIDQYVGKISPYHNEFVKNSNLNNSFVPFNGIFSSQKEPIFLNQSLNFYLKSGIWNVFPFNNPSKFISHFSKYASNETYEYFAKNFITENIELLKLIKKIPDQFNNPVVNDQKTLEDNIKSYFKKNGPATLLKHYVNIFGNQQISTSITHIDSFESINYLYSNLSSTIQTINQIVLSVSIPLIVLMILVISSSMLNEIKKIILILKTLGYSDKENVLTIISVFAPVLIISLIVGALILLASLYSLQFFVYSLTSILLSAWVEFVPFITGIFSLVGILLINYVFIYILYKKQNLSDSIKE